MMVKCARPSPLTPMWSAWCERPCTGSAGGMKTVVNEALRQALGPTLQSREPYRLEVHRSELAPPLDLAGFNKLADEVETEGASGRLGS